MQVKMILAIDSRGGIARGGLIPWDCPEDRAYFRAQTVGSGHNAVVMGRSTFDALPAIPLRKRIPFVVTSRPLTRWRTSTISAPTLAAAYAGAKRIGTFEEFWICGGRRIYDEGLDMPELSEVHLTLVQGAHFTDTPALTGCESARDVLALLSSRGFRVASGQHLGGPAYLVRFTR